MSAGLPEFDDTPLADSAPPWTLERPPDALLQVFPEAAHPPQSPAEVRRLVHLMTTAKGHDEERHWTALRWLGDAVVPYLEEAYPRTGTWHGRLLLVFHSIVPARRGNQAAFRLGIAATGDASYKVRWRACMLLAYAQRQEALPTLQGLLTHPDARTRHDAQSAIDAIQRGRPGAFRV